MGVSGGCRGDRSVRLGVTGVSGGRRGGWGSVEAGGVTWVSGGCRGDGGQQRYGG